MEDSENHHTVSFGLVSRTFSAKFLEVERGAEVNITQSVTTNLIKYSG